MKSILLLLIIFFTCNVSNAALTVGNVPKVKTGGSTPSLEDSTITVSGSNVGIGTSTNITNALVVNGSIQSVGIGTVSADSIVATGTGGLYGDPFNDWMTKIMFGELFPVFGADTRLLLGWMSPATTELDYSGSSTPNNATYVNFSTTDQTRVGFGWKMNLNGTTQYMTIPDSADFNFGDGATDSVMTVGGWFESVAGGVQQFINKYDTTTGSEKRQWAFYQDASELLHLDLWDESANVTCRRVSNAALSAGWHYLVATYAGTGGASACDGITLYVDGLSVAATSTNNASYVAMEDLSNAVWIGANLSSSPPSNVMQGDIGLLFVVGKQLSADEVWQSYVSSSAYLNQ